MKGIPKCWCVAVLFAVVDREIVVGAVSSGSRCRELLIKLLLYLVRVSIKKLCYNLFYNGTLPEYEYNPRHMVFSGIAQHASEGFPGGGAVLYDSPDDFGTPS